MQLENSYPIGVPFRIPRPRGENGGAGTAVGALLALLFTTNPVAVLAGGAIGDALANQPLPLEAAIRSYFAQKGLPIISFYRLGPYAARVLFNYLDQYWIVESHAPQNPNWTPENLDDWLYGDMVQTLEAKLTQINRRLIQ